MFLDILASTAPTRPEIHKLVELRKNTENRVLLCEVKGIPTPTVTWRRKNKALSSRKSFRIKYKNVFSRKKNKSIVRSRLTIRNPSADLLGQYECRAESMDGHEEWRSITILPSNKDCRDDYKKNFCQNGGTCFWEASMGQPGCVCPEHFTGERCETKLPGDTRLLRMTSERWRRRRKKKSGRI
ncbi:hypothetical protein JTB14_032359 [Gonioctena quinquepunctata]|nr:hypothetical protein JTB14_032359 [Gonioctena quinquepunctata]